MEDKTGSGLVRGIRRWDLVAVAVNGIIGAGIFGLPSQVFNLVGSYSLVAFAVCALVVTLIILCFAEVGSRYAETGGPYLYAREAFGPLVGFEVGWMMWLARLTAFAANCNLLADYLGYFFPGADVGTARALVVFFVVASLTMVNIAGVRDAAVTSNIFTVAKLIPISLFIIAGLFFIQPANFSFAETADYDAFSTSVLMLIYAFTGFEMAVIPAGEVRDPRRNLPRAMLTAIAGVAVIYLLIQFVSIGTLPELAGSSRPLADASSRFLGPWGGSMIAFGALISITGNLTVILLAGSRLPFAMAERRELPAVFAVTHPRFRTPHMAILLTSAIVLVMTMWSTFTQALTVSAVARLLAYGATCAALPALRRRSDAPPALFKLRGGVAVAFGSILLAVWLLSNSKLGEARNAALAAGVGLTIYLIAVARRRFASR